MESTHAAHAPESRPRERQSAALCAPSPAAYVILAKIAVT